MFSAVPMLRLSALVLDRDERAVLRGLGELGVVHIARMKAGPETAPFEPPDRSETRLRCERLLVRIADLRRVLDMAPAAAARPPSVSLSVDQIESEIQEAERTAATLSGRRQAAQARRDQVAAVVEQLSSFKGLEVPLDELGALSFLHFAIGSLPEQQFEGLREKVGENVVLLPLPRGEQRRALVAVTSRTGRFALETALQQAKFQREMLPAQNGATVAMLVDESVKERDRQQEDLKQIELATVGLASAVGPRLEELERALLEEQRMLAAEENFTHTEATVLISGWVPESELPVVMRRVKEIARGSCAIEAVAPERLQEDQVPVLLRHPRILRPFEMLVSGYGLPAYRELEPTLFVAITYLLMFGVMFGDVGHGAVLGLGGLAALLAGRTRKLRDVGMLLLMAGVASMLFGAVYGSYFGIARLRAYAIWHDPLEGDPMQLMRGAIGLGVVIISIGVILNIVNRFRKRDWVGGFLDSFGVVGAIFYWGVLGLLLKFTALKERGLTGLMVLLAIVLPLTAWALRAPLMHALDLRARRKPHTGGYFEAAMESLVEAFEAVLGYMANTISFVRLAAYAMSHAAVLMATFVVAAEVRKMSAAGNVLSVLVIVAGNLVAILLEGVIAAVQALRLEYYEFFGKFFSGSGRAFTPFRLETGQE
ncbi:MAG: V-type ATPase 116kDa subunit family protein [Kiritimatiellae bacterium]|nr:V-type ATPase 116kDa subunit family protein [Kiritimatiellia bacterium]